MKKSLVFMFCVSVLGLGLWADSFLGTWTFYYRWYYNQPYVQTTITFNNNWTFTCGSLTGYWYPFEDHNIIWKFANGTTYSGTKVGGVMTGMMMWLISTDPPTTGCWYCVKVSPVPIKKDIKEKVVSSPDTPPKSPSTKK